MFLYFAFLKNIQVIFKKSANVEALPQGYLIITKQRFALKRAFRLEMFLVGFLSKIFDNFEHQLHQI